MKNKKDDRAGRRQEASRGAELRAIYFSRKPPGRLCYVVREYDCVCVSPTRVSASPPTPHPPSVVTDKVPDERRGEEESGAGPPAAAAEPAASGSGRIRRGLAGRAAASPAAAVGCNPPKGGRASTGASPPLDGRPLLLSAGSPPWPCTPPVHESSRAHATRKPL